MFNYWVVKKIEDKWKKRLELGNICSIKIGMYILGLVFIRLEFWIIKYTYICIK